MTSATGKPGVEGAASGARTSLRGHIAVEGVIGAGKTAFCERLARRCDGKAVLEIVDDNPFLGRFYNDRRRYAFQTQLCFLLSRHTQQQELKQRDIFHDLVVCDYLFQKDRIFANLNLSEHEFRLYEQIVGFLERELPVPDLVVYLQAPAPVLLERIRTRGRPFERRIDHGYIQELTEAYNYFFFHYDAAPLLIVNTTRIDLVSREDDFEDLLRQMEKHDHGTAYYSPGGRV